MSRGKRPFRLTVVDFKGLGLDVHRSRLPDDKFQIDEGGDHFGEGRWKVRRGRQHTDFAKVTGAVVSILGFELPGGDTALIFTAGSSAYGETNVEIQGTGDDEEGFGEGGFGEGGFGA